MGGGRKNRKKRGVSQNIRLGKGREAWKVARIKKSKPFKKEGAPLWTVSWKGSIKKPDRSTRKFLRLMSGDSVSLSRPQPRSEWGGINLIKRGEKGENFATKRHQGREGGFRVASQKKRNPTMPQRLPLEHNFRLE